MNKHFLRTKLSKTGNSFIRTNNLLSHSITHLVFNITTLHNFSP
nr:MAG TPA: hypothetical protein [Caudoviricetes sp.]